MRIRRSSNAFEEKFTDSKDLETDFAICSNPFSVNSEEVPHKYQMVIELLCNSVLKAKSENVDIKTFYQYIGPTYRQIKVLTSKIMSMFATTYACEQLFSLNLNKSRFRSQLTDAHLNSTLKVVIVIAQSLVPDINKACKCQRMPGFFESQC